jgi:hypothetical protein
VTLSAVIFWKELDGKKRLDDSGERKARKAQYL